MTIPEELEPAKSNVIELREGHKYLICIDEAAVTKEDVFSLMEQLKHAGIGWAIAMMVKGDPRTAVKVIEDKPNAQE